MKSSYIFVLVLIVGIFAFLGVLVLTGLQDDSTNETEADSTNTQNEIVVDVIDNSNEDSDSDNPSNPSIPEVEEEDDSTTSEIKDDSEEKDETSTPTEAPSPNQSEKVTVGSATAQDNVNVGGYNYYTQNGQLYFEWTVSKNTPKAEGYYEGNVIVVSFPSVTKDFILENEALGGEDLKSDLGNLLPDLKGVRSDVTSKYTFTNKNDVKKDFQLVQATNEDGVNILRLTIDL